MTITLLLDLDDTLIDSNMDVFIPAYFQALAKTLSGNVSPEIMLPALMAGTKAMMANDDPALTLREVFDAKFYPKLGTDRETLQPVIEHFYDEIFPTLRHLTMPRTEAIRMVDRSFANGYRVVVATNPLFPLKAIQHRLRWAELPPEKYPYALVTSYEHFHFTKETVAYYSEIMGQLGWPEDPVIMLGDDIGRDVEPSIKAGLPIFWVKKTDDSYSENTTLPQGTLDQFQTWLESVDISQKLQPSFKTPHALLAVLRSTPAALSTLTLSLPSQIWYSRPNLGEWCLSEIICHLCEMEIEVNLPNLRKILVENIPHNAERNVVLGVEERQFSSYDGLQALTDFTGARKEVLGILNNLCTEWSSSTDQLNFGSTELQKLVDFIAKHDRLHIQQVWKTIHGDSKG